MSLQEEDQILARVLNMSFAMPETSAPDTTTENLRPTSYDLGVVSSRPLPKKDLCNLADERPVEIVLNRFSVTPERIVIAPGKTLKIVNKRSKTTTVEHFGLDGAATHIKEGATITLRPQDAGTFVVQCRGHPHMRSTAVVTRNA